MNLYAVHRLLIRVFIVAAVLFGVLEIKRWFATGDSMALVLGIAALVISVVAVGYLMSAPYLKQK